MEKTTEKKPGRGKAFRRRMAAKHKKVRMEIVTRYYISGAGYVDWALVDGDLKPVGTYVKYPKNSRKQQELKRYSNKLIRRNGELFQGNGYRKCFDYQWTMW